MFFAKLFWYEQDPPAAPSWDSFFTTNLLTRNTFHRYFLGDLIRWLLSVLMVEKLWVANSLTYVARYAISSKSSGILPNNVALLKTNPVTDEISLTIKSIANDKVIGKLVNNLGQVVRTGNSAKGGMIGTITEKYFPV